MLCKGAVADCLLPWGICGCRCGPECWGICDVLD